MSQSTLSETSQRIFSMGKISAGMNTADIIVEKLIAWEVKFIFSLVRDGINPIYEALRKRKDEITLITVRHEEAAAFMASGFAKSTGQLAVCLATTGPGAVHLMNGLYDAAMESVPVLVITGIVDHDLLGTQFIQEVDTVTMLNDITVYNQAITGPVHARTVVDLACRSAIMMNGVSHIAVPTDIQQQKLKEDEHSKKGGTLVGSSGFTKKIDTAGKEELLQAAALLNDSNKIMILAGKGALDASDELEEIAEKLGAPVAKALLGKAVLPDDSPYTTGGIGRLGTLPSKEMMEDCDMLLIAGSTMPYLEYYPKPGQAKGIQIDHDPRRIGIRFPVDIGLQGDIKATLRALMPYINYRTDRSFLELAQQRMQSWNSLRAKIETDHTTPVQPAFLVSLVSRLAKKDAVITIDTGAHTVFTARHFQVKKEQQIIACGTLASMGPALSYGIAAQLAWPGRQCIVMTGDGGLTMLMGELATAVLYSLPVKIIVFKNNQLAMDRFEQEEIGGKKYGIDLQPIDFAMIADACGAKGFTCNEPAELDMVIKKAFAMDGPVLVQVQVDADAVPGPPEKMKS